VTALKAFVIAALVAAVLSLVVIVWWDSTRSVTVVVMGNPDATVVVQVSGAVASPGLISLSAGSRVEQAISAAGGLTTDADVSQLYLAARIGDGERIVIPAKGSTSSSSSKVNDGNPQARSTETHEASSEPDGTVQALDINTATVEQLVALPGIGQVLAERIVAYRDAHGPFTSVNQLGDVEGIGDALVERLRPLVIVRD
jgi:competence protein ComEA